MAKTVDWRAESPCRVRCTTNNDSRHYDQTSVYPTAIAAYNLSQPRQLQVSYSRRVTPPDARQLNPFVFRETRSTSSRGISAQAPVPLERGSQYLHVVPSVKTFSDIVVRLFRYSLPIL